MKRTMRSIGANQHEVLEDGQVVMTLRFVREHTKHGVICSGWIRDERTGAYQRPDEGKGWWCYFKDAKQDLLNGWSM